MIGTARWLLGAVVAAFVVAGLAVPQAGAAVKLRGQVNLAAVRAGAAATPRRVADPSAAGVASVGVTQPSASITQGTPVDLGAGWVPEAVNGDDEIAMVKFGAGVAARWDAGTVTDLQTPSWLQPANGGSVQSITGISTDGAVVGNGTVSQGTDPNLASTDAGGATADMAGTVGLIWPVDSSDAIEVDPPATYAWIYTQDHPTLTISGISASGTIALNELYMPPVTESNGSYTPEQVYNLPEITDSTGGDVRDVPDPTHIETLGAIAGNDIVVSTCQDAPSFYYETCQPGQYVANRIATVSPLAVTTDLASIAGIAADGTVVGSNADGEYVEVLPNDQQVAIPAADVPYGVVKADEVMVITNQGDSIWQGSCGQATAVASLFPTNSGWSGIEVSGWNASGDLIGTGTLDGATHGFLLRPVLASCAAPTVTKLTPSSGPESGGTRVTITGTGFASGAVVQFGSATAKDVSVKSTTEMLATAPAGTGAQHVQVTLNGASSPPAAANLFTYKAAANLGLKLSAASKLRRGKTTQVTLTVKNAGPATAKSVVATLTLGAHLRLVSGAGAKRSGSRLIWHIASLAAHRSHVLHATVKASGAHPSRSSLAATVSSSTLDPAKKNNTAKRELKVT